MAFAANDVLIFVAASNASLASRRHSRNFLGNGLYLAPAAPAAEMDRFRVGDVGKQSQGEILFDHDKTRTSDGRRRFALRKLLVVAQVALSLILLVGAGLFIRSLRYVQAIDPGFDTRNGLVMSLNPGLLGYSEDGGGQLQSQLVERLAGLPGVSAVTTADYFPLGFIGLSNPITIEGQAPPPDGRPMMAVRQRIGLRYFETMGIPLLRGRAFTAADTASSDPVVIVNQTLARRHWPISQDIGEVIGRRSHRLRSKRSVERNRQCGG
jgi:hypothetical protein